MGLRSILWVGRIPRAGSQRRSCKGKAPAVEWSLKVQETEVMLP